MKRINLYIDEKSFNQLKALPSTISENVRSAVYEYLRKLKEYDSSASQSKRKDGE